LQVVVVFLIESSFLFLVNLLCAECINTGVNMESQGGVCNVQGHFAPQNLISQKSTGDHNTFFDV